MSDAEIQQRFESVLSTVRQPARLIGGEPGSGSGFAGISDELRVVLAFPDTYEIGISNQALQILYHIAGDTRGVAVERTYLPWVDASAEMRAAGVPLLTMETWSPVASADLLAITLQHEFDYTNVLELLDLAAIPLRATDRGEGLPLVVAGGPACADFLPMARFFDAVAVGDGEEIFPEILEVLARTKKEGSPRTEVKASLSRLSGVYVPGVSQGVERRVAGRLAGAAYPDACLVPLTAGVHDRAWVEVMRGCTRGCRFCQAGMWYRPVRERPPDEIVSMATAQLASSGHQELALGSLSTTDYSCLEDVLARMAREHPEVRVSLPSLRVDSAAVRLARLASPTGPSLTLAPEAGSQRMRDVINKNVSEDDVMAAAQEAFSTGRTTLKLYFMIGLPTETDEDVAAISELCVKIWELGRRALGSRAGRLQLNISVNNFIPKPFTPFQWAGMADRETLLRRQQLLRSGLRRPGIKLALHSVDKSYLEAALARGGEETGAVIEQAWRSGARFDSWTEQFRAEAWRQAWESLGTSAEQEATRSLARDVPLPWEIISQAVQRDFLWDEWERAQREETTPDCRWEGCSDCGACKDGPANDLAGGTDVGAPEAGRPGTAEAGAAHQGAAAPAGGSGRRWRYVATFSVTGRGRYIGHLDRVEVFRRAIRRAGGRLALSAGMRPKALLSLALPLAVGVEGLGELCEFELAEEPADSFFSRLSRALPEHMDLIALEPYEAPRSLPSRVVGAVYEVGVRGVTGPSGGVGLRGVLEEAAQRFEAAAELPTEEVKEGKVRRVDVRKYVDSVVVREGTDTPSVLAFRAAVTPAGTARPERVVEALGRLAATGLTIDWVRRTRIELT